MKKNLFSEDTKRNTRRIVLTSAFSLALASASLTGCGFASKNASSSVYMAETAAAYDMTAASASGTRTGMPASFSKSASANFNGSTEDAYAAAGDYAAVTEEDSADSGSVELSQETLLSQNVPNSEENPTTDPSPSSHASSEISQTPVERKLIRNVNMDLETRDFDGLTKAISDVVTSFGGYIEQSDISGNSLNWSGDRSSRYSSITARIPSDRLDDFLTEVSSQGNVTYKNESVQDVTLQYTDMTSRKKTLQMEQKRLWELLEKAESVDAVIALESRLSEVRYQLESLESQLRTLDNQIVYSTVYLSIQEVQVLTSTDPDTIPVRIQKGLSRSINQLSVFSINFLVWFVSSLPILAVLAVLILIGITVWRKILKKEEPGKHRNAAENESKEAQAEPKENIK